MTILLVLLVVTTLYQSGQCDADRPPKMLSKFKREYWLQRSNLVSLTLTCQAMNGDITYTWKKNGYDEVRSSQQVSVDSKTGTIVFRDVQVTDFGTYQCFAKNALGTALSEPVEIREVRLDRFSSSEVQNDNCTLNVMCTIKCRGREQAICEPRSNCSEEWKIGLGVNKNLQITNRVAVTGDGDLIFLYTEKGDHQEGLTYGCGLWNENLKSLKKGSLSTVNVLTNPSISKIPQMAPNKTYSKGGTGHIGGKAKMSCIFRGYPIPDITWYTPKSQQINNLTGKYQIEDFGRRLVINSLTKDDEGEYKCSGFNGRSTDKIDDTFALVFLNVTSPPFLGPASTMVDKFVDVQGKPTFVCDAQSLAGERAPSQPKWMKNGHPIATGGIYTISSDGKTLTINLARKSDIGNYQCSAENSEGMIFADAFLMVVDAITVENTISERYIVSAGQQQVLFVSAFTDPTLSLRYEWIFVDSRNQSRTVMNNGFWQLSDNNKNLTISTLEDMSQDASMARNVYGQYKARIYNEVQEMIISTTIARTNATAPTPAPQADDGSPFPIWIIGVIVGIILLIVLILYIVYYKTRNKGGTYPVDKKEVAAGHNPMKELENGGIHDLSRTDDLDGPTDRKSLIENSEKPDKFSEDKYNEDDKFTTTSHSDV